MTLTDPSTSWPLSMHALYDPDIWVDASTEWGIGIIIAGCWAAWHLVDGWKVDGRDISWAEAIALKLAILWLKQQKFGDAEIIIRGDNTGVIGTFNKGQSRNLQCNNSIQHITSSLIPFNLTILPIYVHSAKNQTDPKSMQQTQITSETV